VADPELESYYWQQLEAHGKEGFVYSPPGDFSILFIADDPDRAWQELGHHFLNEALEYSSWSPENLKRPLEFTSNSVEALREEGRYEIITPAQCLQRHRQSEDFFALLHPLVGGMPLDRGWDCLRLYAEQVLAKL
jgi:hypothetical protein